MIRNALLLLVVTSLLSACAPTTQETVDLSELPCQNEPPPTVAVIEFENTTSRSGTHVTGMEDAATARLITLMKESACYQVVEQSALQGLIVEQGLESMDPVDLAKAAGAGFVITGTVTRATIAEPGLAAFGVSVGATTAEVEVDVRATDIITGEVVVSMTGAGNASSPDIAVDRIPAGRISYDDPTVGPLLAEASAQAVNRVMAALRTTF